MKSHGTLRFLLAAVAVCAVTLLIYGTAPGRALDLYLNQVWANGLYHVLGQCGMSVVLYKNYVFAPGFSVRLVGNCNALFCIVVVVVGALFLPAPLKRRGVVLGLFVLGICAINLLRLISVVLLGTASPQVGVWVHDYIWPVLFGLLVLAGARQMVGRPPAVKPV